MGNAYMGKILLVNLTSGTWEEETLSESFYQNHLSGMGLAARILYDRIPANADPLGPDNMLGFVSGLLTSTGSLFTGRWMVAGKSPLTGGWGDANCGGYLSPAIKRCGYDGIFVSGVSSKPTYLAIENGTIALKDAADLWGRDAIDTEDLLKERHGARAQVATIGAGGEKLSLMAGIVNDRGRMAARSGLGAVMGSKKLKAIVLQGKEKVQVHDRGAMKQITAICNGALKTKLPLPPSAATPFMGKVMGALPVSMVMDGMLYINMLRKWGTSSMNQASIEMGDSPLQNWKGTSRDFPRSRSATVAPDRIIEREEKKYNCFSCPLACGGICKGSGGFKETHKPEYETTLALGGLLLNEDLDTIFYLNELFNRAGIDTISAGSAIAFAMECYEKGVLTKEQLDGIELTWGNSEAIKEMARKIIARDGIGDLLADGSKKAAEKLGNEAFQYAMQAGGQDLPMHDSRLDPGHAVLFSADPTPGRHTTGCYLYYEMYQLWKVASSAPKPATFHHRDSRYKPDAKKAAISAILSKYTCCFNGAGLCMFGAFMGAGRIRIFDWMNAATGWTYTADEYLEIGGRIQTLRQAFNVKHGIDPKQNRAPDRALGRPPQRAGFNKGRSIDVERMITDYWQQMGWNADTGKPLPTTLKKYEIE